MESYRSWRLKGSHVVSNLLQPFIVCCAFRGRSITINNFMYSMVYLNLEVSVAFMLIIGVNKYMENNFGGYRFYSNRTSQNSFVSFVFIKTSLFYFAFVIECNIRSMFLTSYHKLQSIILTQIQCLLGHPCYLEGNILFSKRKKTL